MIKSYILFKWKWFKAIFFWLNLILTPNGSTTFFGLLGLSSLHTRSTRFIDTGTNVWPYVFNSLNNSFHDDVLIKKGSIPTKDSTSKHWDNHFAWLGVSGRPVK